MNQKLIQVGVEDFSEVRKLNAYYVDKTRFIGELLQNRGSKVSLFTRPRRFGKTLNMSMLRYFFEIGSDPRLFEGLEIAEDRELCGEYQGKYPVIFISLKGVRGLNYPEALTRMADVIRAEADRHRGILEDDILNAFDKKLMGTLCEGTAELGGSLQKLSELLHKYYNRKTIILIDEYDVPLQKAEQNGYYDEMTEFISTFLAMP